MKHLQDSKTHPVSLIYPWTIRPISFSLSKCPNVEMTLSVQVCFLMSEYQKNGSFVPLNEVDASSVVIGEVTMLNTLKHYQVRDIRRSAVEFCLVWWLLLRVDSQITQSVIGLSLKTVEDTRREAHNCRRSHCCLKPFVL